MNRLQIVRAAGVVLLVCGVAAAQAPVRQPGITGPPACSAREKPSIAVASVAGRRNAEAALAVEKASAAQAGVLVSASPLENLDIARDRIADYADCVGSEGCYWTDLDAAEQRAAAALAGLIAAQRPGEKTALIFDIDETTLSSYCEMKREDFGYVDAMFNAWVVTQDAAVPIPGSVRLFRQARAAGIAVFFITGRPDSQRVATERNLRAAGYAGWTHLAMRDASEIKMPTQAYKSLERKKIVDEGYRILMNVGDQWSDLNGEPRAEWSVKLPNPFYFLP